MKREVIAEYTYELPELTDEEIMSVAESEGITDANPEEIRTFIKKSIYKVFCEVQIKNSTT